ncbi:hypothetical protein, conserved [Babesia ovata]|uniref:Extracellular matrix-binding ebh n=1 Tax=Babesia ovata TaxID=189622 RepID=A0A2H6K6R0_9APIC|nr:uncharacterized protein BOVATA_001630 [Babesia ovata]GBE58670.1 hypothetical protein, conserved [Babesia ovata]
MAPKKLTDCPENLRESIDWLIQVKHGNGTNGLEELANALKKLVTEAIKNASESLENRQKELLCADKNSGGLYDNHCQKLQKEIDDATKSEKSEDEISKLKKKKNDHYNDVHYLSEDARERALGDITERQNKLTELQKSLSNFTDQNNCNQLLTNLTEGLEKFLGYNSDSKGYSGEGIVYSDLDRLCDGVMAFLHGVLESVKGDENVTKYSVSSELDGILQYLQNSIGKGATQLAGQIKEVSQWLNKYELKVGQKTGNVVMKLGELKDEKMNQYMILVQDNQGRKLQDQLQSWRDIVSKMFGEIETIQNKHVNMLNPALKDKINIQINPVKEVVQVLYDSSKVEEFGSQAKQVEDQLVKQQRNIENKIEDQGNNVKKELVAQESSVLKKIEQGFPDLQGKVDEGLKRIINKIFDLEVEKKKQIKAIQVSMNTAKNDTDKLLKEFKTTYETDIRTHFEQIRTALQKVTPEQPGDESELLKEVKKIADNLRSVGDQLNGENEKLGKWKEKATDVVTNALGKCEKMLQRLDKECKENIPEDKRVIKIRSEELKNRAAMLLEAYRKTNEGLTGIMDGINRAVGDIEKAYLLKLRMLKFEVEDAVGKDEDDKETTVLGRLNKLDNDVKKGLLKVRERIKTDLKTYVENGILSEIKQGVDVIRGQGGGEDGLEGIKQKVKEYVEKYGTGFTVTVGRWVTDIIGKKPVSDYVAEYSGSNKSYKNFLPPYNDKGQNTAKDAIIKNMESVIKMKLKTIISAATDSIGSNQDQINVTVCLTKIKTCLTTFADRLEDEMSKTLKPSAVVTEIEGNLKSEQVIKQTPIVTDNFHLEDAIKTALRALVSTAKQCGDQIQRLVDGCKLGNINSALNKAEELDGKLTTNTFGGKSPKTVDQGIEGELEKTIMQVQESNLKNLQLRKDGPNELMSDYKAATEIKNDGDAKTDGELRALIKTIKKKFEGLITGDSNSGYSLNPDKITGYNTPSSYINSTQGAKAAYEAAVGKVTTHVLSAFHTITGSDGKPVITQAGKIGTETTAIDYAFGEIDQQLAYLTMLVNNPNGGVDEKGVKTLLGDLNKMLTVDNFSELYGLKNGLAMIHKQLVNLHSSEFTGNETGKIQSVINQVIKTVKILEVVPGMVETRKAQALQKMSDLEQAIKKIHQQIHGALITVGIVDDRLNKVIKAVQRAVEEAHENSKQAVQKLQKDLTNAVKDAFQKFQHSVDTLKGELTAEVLTAFGCVTSEIRGMFAYNRKADLMALQKSIAWHLRKIKHIISKDLNTGIKGLLKTLNGKKMEISVTGLPKFDDPSTELLDEILKDLPQSPPFTKQNFTKLSTAFDAYYNNIHKYTKMQLIPKIPPSSEVQDQSNPSLRPVPPPISGGSYRARPATATMKEISEIANPPGRAGMGNTSQSTTPSPTPSTSQQPPSPSTKNPIEQFFDDLKVYTRRLFLALSGGFFSRTFSSQREEFEKFLYSMRPTKFAEHDSPPLDTLKSGLQHFLKQLSYAYVNVYDAVTFKRLTEQKQITNPVTQAKTSETQLTTEGRNCAKVCLTILETLFYDFNSLSKLFPSKGADNIFSYSTSGKYFHDRGYRVASKDGVQDGELDNSTKTSGQKINELRDSQITGATHTDNKLYGFINEICRDIVSYYRVCQYYIPSKPRAPTTVNEMLHWLAGLYYTPMYDKLASKFAGYFNVPQENGTTVIKPIEAAVPARRSERMLRSLSLREMSALFNNITIRPYHILVAILGNGHAGGRYACDFLTNPDDLLYPSNTDQCLHMLLEICLRLNEQILFLFKQCHNDAISSGWRDCLYGKGIAGAAWNCNTMQCPNQGCDQKHNQTCDQKADRNADQHYKCGIKSPLQSFLEDGLVGFLPHQFTSPGCEKPLMMPSRKPISGMMKQNWTSQKS